MFLVMLSYSFNTHSLITSCLPGDVQQMATSPPSHSGSGSQVLDDGSLFQRLLHWKCERRTGNLQRKNRLQEGPRGLDEPAVLRTHQVVQPGQLVHGGAADVGGRG